QSDADLDFIAGSGATASLNISPGGTLRKSAGTLVSFTDFNVTNNGTLDVRTGTLDLTGAFTNFAGTTLTGGTYLVTSTLRFVGANVVTTAATIVLDGAASAIVNSSNGNALANFATNTASGSFTIRNGRTITTPAFSNAGTVAIGAGSNFLTSGTYTPTSTGALNIEIAGTTPGTQFGRLDVSGQATLAGTLNISLTGGFTPAAPDTFRILNASPRTGTFATANGLLFPGGRLVVLYNADNVTLDANLAPNAVS